jgi:hypothetical protein
MRSKSPCRILDFLGYEHGESHLLRILLNSGFGAEKQHKEKLKRFPRRDRMRSATVVVHLV